MLSNNLQKNCLQHFTADSEISSDNNLVTFFLQFYVEQDVNYPYCVCRDYEKEHFVCLVNVIILTALRRT